MARHLSRDRYLVREELQRLFYAARTRPHVRAKRDHALLVVLGLLGLRVSEVLALTWGDLVLGRVEAEASFLRVRRLKRRGEVVHELAAPRSAVRILLAYLRSLPDAERAPAAPIFVMTRQNVWAIVKRYAKLANLNPRYTTHSLRHTRAVLLYEETRDVVLVKEALGHAKLDTTMIYVHAVDGARRIAACDGFEGEAAAAEA